MSDSRAAADGPTGGSVDPDTRWGAAIAAFGDYSANRRDPQRLQSLLRAFEQTGLDAAVSDAFRQVCRAELPAVDVSQALSSLTLAQRLELLSILFEQCTPIRTVAYPTRGEVPADSELAQHGISVDAVQRTGDNYPPGSHFMPYHEVVLGHKRVELSSPLSGRPLVSSTCLLLLAGSGRPIIAYHFVDDGEPFFLIVHTFSGSWSGLLFPERDLLLSVPAEAPRVLAMFRALVTEFAAQTVAHINYEGERPLGLLVGAMNHFGHSILNEFDAAHQCCEAGLFDGVATVLRGWANFMEHTEIFPELSEKPVLQLDDAATAYRTVVEEHFVVTRPTCNSYWCSIGLCDRLRAAAERHMAAAPSEELSRAKRCWPLLWIEIRSHDRRWIDQEDQLPQLIDNLAARFPDLGVIMGGWSRMIGANPPDEKMVASDQAVALSMMQKVMSEVSLFDITGVITLEKMAWAMACDVFVSTYGTGLIFPCFVGRSPGVMHTNSGYLAALKRIRRGPLVPWQEALPEIRLIEAEHIVDEDPDQPHGIRSHYMPWQPVFEELTSILSDLPQAQQLRA